MQECVAWGSSRPLSHSAPMRKRSPSMQSAQWRIVEEAPASRAPCHQPTMSHYCDSDLQLQPAKTMGATQGIENGRLLPSGVDFGHHTTGAATTSDSLPPLSWCHLTCGTNSDEINAGPDAGRDYDATERACQDRRATHLS